MKQKIKLQTYYPNPVYLPEGIERKPPANVGELAEHEKKSFDSKTLFYDIFFQSNRLICIGPPFLNIAPLLAIKYKYKGKNTRAAWDKSGTIRFTIIYIDIRPNNVPSELEFIFKNFTTKVTVIRPNTTPLLSKVDLSLVTMQKDSPLIWIKDFCIWHTRAAGVKRIVLYDNGSSYFSDLSKYLTELNGEFELVLVHWPFPYGFPGEKGDRTRCTAQMGALNHFRSFFGNNTTWVISLDIDEFVYCEGSLPLTKFLALPKALGRPEWLLKQRRCPTPFFASNQQHLDQIRFYHHQIRRKQYPTVYPKYVCQPRLVKSMGAHISRPSLKLIAKAIFQSNPYVSIRLIEKPLINLRNKRNYTQIPTFP